MGIQATYGKDKVKATEGVWIELAGSEFRCTFFDGKSPEYSKIFRRLTRPVAKLIQHDALPPEKDREIAMRAFIEHSLKDWRTSDGKHYAPEVEIEDDEGNPVKLTFSVDNAVRLFTAYPQLWHDLIGEAAELNNYKPTDTERKN